MSKFTCLVVCVVAASLNSVHVTRADKPSLRDNLRPILEACVKEFPGLSIEDVDKATESGDLSYINNCYNRCVFKNAGFINEKGEFDLKTGLANLRQAVSDDEEYKKLVDIATRCINANTPVTDGDAGCDRGNQLSRCFLNNKSIVTL